MNTTASAKLLNRIKPARIVLYMSNSIKPVPKAVVRKKAPLREGIEPYGWFMLVKISKWLNTLFTVEFFSGNPSGLIQFRCMAGKTEILEGKSYK